MLIGYVAAVAAATAVTVALLLAPVALSSGSLGAATFILADEAPLMLAIGFLWTFICALPGFIVAIVLGEGRHWQGSHAYAFAGLLNVIPSLAISGGLTGDSIGALAPLLAVFSGGFAGGAAYWAGAGRFIAARRYAQQA